MIVPTERIRLIQGYLGNVLPIAREFYDSKTREERHDYSRIARAVTAKLVPNLDAGNISAFIRTGAITEDDKARPVSEFDYDFITQCRAEDETIWNQADHFINKIYDAYMQEVLGEQIGEEIPNINIIRGNIARVFGTLQEEERPVLETTLRYCFYLKLADWLQKLKSSDFDYDTEVIPAGEKLGSELMAIPFTQFKAQKHIPLTKSEIYEILTLFPNDNVVKNVIPELLLKLIRERATYKAMLIRKSGALDSQ